MTPAQVAHIMSLVDHYGSAIMLHDFAETTRARAAVEAALLAPQQAEPGFVMVPVDPTPEMLAAILEPIKWAGGKDAYRAMLAARPSAPTAVEPVRERWLCLSCLSDRTGYHRTLDDKVTPCPQGAARASKGTP